MSSEELPQFDGMAGPDSDMDYLNEGIYIYIIFRKYLCVCIICPKIR
jgi:hypothetical protein